MGECESRARGDEKVVPLETAGEAPDEVADGHFEGAALVAGDAVRFDAVHEVRVEAVVSWGGHAFDDEC